MAKIGFYAGSFSPFTRGHLAIVCEALNDYDQIVIGVGVNKDKSTNFSPELCCQMIENSIDDLLWEFRFKDFLDKKFSETEKSALSKLLRNRQCVKAINYQGLTIDAALQHKATALIRGERIIGDHDAEMQLSILNKQLLEVRHAHLSMVSIPVPREEMTYISSSNVRAFCKMGEYVAAMSYVTPKVHALMMETCLHERFVGLISSDYVSAAMVEERWQELVLAYSQNRYYHSLSHIAYMLNYLDIFERVDNIKIADKKALELAIFYHDFVMNNKPDDEEKSCEVLVQACRDPKLYQTTDNLILATCHCRYNPLDKLPEKLIHDLDLVVLGDERNYANYAIGVRREFMDAETIDYCKGRTTVIKRLLAQTRLFKTDYFHNLLEETTRQNLKKELSFWESIG